MHVQLGQNRVFQRPLRPLHVVAVVGYQQQARRGGYQLFQRQGAVALYARLGGGIAPASQVEHIVIQRLAASAARRCAIQRGRRALAGRGSRRACSGCCIFGGNGIGQMLPGQLHAAHNGAAAGFIARVAGDQHDLRLRFLQAVNAGHHQHRYAELAQHLRGVARGKCARQHQIGLERQHLFGAAAYNRNALRLLRQHGRFRIAHQPAQADNAPLVDQLQQQLVGA